MFFVLLWDVKKKLYKRIIFYKCFKYFILVLECIIIWNYGFYIYGILCFFVYIYFLSIDKEENKFKWLNNIYYISNRNLFLY